MAWSEELEEEKGWIDLQIVDSWNIPKRYVAGSFPDDIWIREKACEFEERDILGRKLRITFPKSAEPMTEKSEELIPAFMKELCAGWFPQGEAYFSKEWNCGFAFLLQEEETDGETFYEKTVEMMESYDEETIFYDKEIEESYTTFTVKSNLEEGEQIYSFPFQVNISEKQLVGIVVCDVEDAAIWRLLSYSIFHSAI